MTDNKISVRQICLMFIAFSTSVKMIFTAAVTARYSAHLLWVSALINFAIDGLIIFIALKISERFPNKTLFEILSDNLNASVAKTVFFIYGVAFFLKAFVPIHEQKVFVEICLYETFPKVITFTPFFLFSAYFSFKGLKGVARCSEIIVWFTLAAVPALIALALPNADFSELLPLFKGVTVNSVAEGSLKTSVWYFDGLYALMLVGRFKKEKLTKTKILGGFFISAILVISYMASLYAEYGNLTERQFFAPVKIGLLSVALLNIGRVDYTLALLTTVSNVFASALPLVFSTYCFGKTFNFKNKIIPALSVNSIMFIAVSLTKDLFSSILQIFQNYYAFFALFTSIVIPAVSFFLKKGRVKR